MKCHAFVSNSKIFEEIAFYNYFVRFLAVTIILFQLMQYVLFENLYKYVFYVNAHEHIILNSV